NSYCEDSDDRSMIICIVDMKSSSSFQINYLKNCFDNHKNLKASVIIIMHFSAEMIYSSMTPYHAIFLNGWDFIYIDACGLLGPEQEYKRLDHNINDSSSKVVNSWTWIAWAFGLSEAPLTHDHFISTFQSLFYRLFD